jgi:hypothetical protein
VPSGDELLERTLIFSGTYVSDDGQLIIRHFAGSPDYSGSRYLGYCRSCARARVIPETGEPLPDLSSAARFAATHHHGDID